MCIRGIKRHCSISKHKNVAMWLLTQMWMRAAFLSSALMNFMGWWRLVGACLIRRFTKKKKALYESSNSSVVQMKGWGKKGKLTGPCDS